MRKYQKEWPFNMLDKTDTMGEDSFLRSLDESRMFRNRGDLTKPTHDQAAGLFYLYFLALYAMTETNNPEQARKYISHTVSLNNFDHFRVGLNDYYNLAHLMYGDVGYGKQDIVTAITKDRSMGPKFLRLNRILSRGGSISTEVLNFTMRLEKTLRINNGVYKDMRRNILNWDNLNDRAQRTTLTRLARHIRALNPRADMLDLLKDHVGAIGTMSNSQKAALGVGIFATGALAGYKMTRNKKQ